MVRNKTLRRFYDPTVAILQTGDQVVVVRQALDETDAGARSRLLSRLDWTDAVPLRMTADERRGGRAATRDAAVNEPRQGAPGHGG